ncbi:MAG: helix-turn-helix transcriptional regulator [Verrucomicrobiales bacterium]
MSPEPKPPFNVQLGKNIARLRHKKSLTQEALAETSQISTRYLQDLEAGKYCPTLLMAERLRKGLGCSWEDLLKSCRG